MTTVAYQGRGSHLATSPDGVSYTNVAQLKTIAFSGAEAAFEDITNLDSPTIFKEWIKTIVDAKDVSFTGILNPADPSTQGLLTQLQAAGSASQYYWKITLPNGSVIAFQGFVSGLNLVNVDYSKALTFSGKIMIVGPIVPTW